MLFEWSNGHAVDPEELRRASSAGFVAVQAFLGEQAGNRLEGLVFHEITNARRWLGRAMDVVCPSRGYRKRLELALASQPLTVCEVWLDVDHYRGGQGTFLVDCGLVFEDRADASGGGRLWREACPAHKRNKHPERSLPRHLNLAKR